MIQQKTKQLPEGWKEKSFSKCFKSISPTNKIQKSNYLENGNLPVIDQGKKLIAGYIYDESKKQITNLPVIIFGDHTRRFKFVNFDFVAGADGIKILEIENNLDPRFAYYQCLTLKFPNKGYSRHFQYVKKSNLVFPPLPLQQKIVSAIETQFTRLDDAVKSLKAVKQKIQLYRKAVLKKAFEKGERWEEKKIGEVFITNPQKQEIKDLSDDLDVSFVPMKFISAKLKKIIDKEIKKLSQVRKGYTYFKNDDLILAKITPCFENGKMAIAQGLNNKIGFGSTEFHVFRFEKDVITKFLFYFLQQDYFRSEAKRKMTGTAGQLRVPIKFIEGFSIPFPSLPLQSQIVSQIESSFSVIDKVEIAVDNSLKKAEQLRKSILKSAFEGRLVEELKVTTK